MPITTSTNYVNWANLVTMYGIDTTTNSSPVGKPKMPKFKVGDIVKWVSYPTENKNFYVDLGSFAFRTGKKLTVVVCTGNSCGTKINIKDQNEFDYWIPNDCLELADPFEEDLMAKTNYTTFVQELGCLSREAAEVANNINLKVKVDPKLGLSIEHFNEIKAQFKVIQKLIANHPEEDELEYIKDQMKDILSILSKSVKARTKIELEKKEYMEVLRAKIEDKVPF